MTRLIQALEDELKIRLLHRTTRSVTVTAEGAAYYERVVRLLAELADIESSAKQSLASPTGRVRVETAAALASMVIIPALGGSTGRIPTWKYERRTRSIPIRVIYPPNRYLSAKVRVFIDWVVTLFERDELLRREPTHA